MTIESQQANNARYAELLELAKWNVCGECRNDIVVACAHSVWWLWCPYCKKFVFRSILKPKPTRAEEAKERLAKMEIAAKTPTSKYNIDEIIKEL